MVKVFLIALIFPVLWCCGIHAQSAAQPQNFRIGVLYWSMNIPGQIAMRHGLENESSRINVTRGDSPGITLIPRVAGDGGDGMERQIAQMRELIEMKVDLIIAQPTDCAALVEPLRLANQAGIPVIVYDQYISNGEVVSYVTSDNYQAGYLNGEYACARLPENRPIRIVMVEYPYVSSTVERVDGFLDAFHDLGRPYEIIGRYIAVEPQQGAAAGRAFLNDFPLPDTVDVVFTVNDGGGVAFFSELIRAGRNEIFGASIDGDPAAVEIIAANGIIKVDSAQFCGKIGETAMRLAYDYLNGKPIPEQVLIPVFPITVETVNRYNGWLGNFPEKFEKTWPSRYPLWTPELKKIWNK